MSLRIFFLCPEEIYINNQKIIISNDTWKTRCEEKNKWLEGEGWRKFSHTLNVKKILELFLERYVENLQVKKSISFGMHLRGRNEAGKESCSLVLVHTAY